MKVDDSRKRVYLEINGLTAGEYIVYVRLNGLKSATGTSPWSTEAWYTLNAFGTGEPFSNPIVGLESEGKIPADLTLARTGGEMSFRVAATAGYELKILDSRGVQVARFAGKAGTGSHSLSLKGLAPGVYAASLRCGGRNLSRAFTAW